MNTELRDALRMLEKEKGIPASQIIQKLCDALVVVARKECKDKDGGQLLCRSQDI